MSVCSETGNWLNFKRRKCHRFNSYGPSTWTANHIAIGIGFCFFFYDKSFSGKNPDLWYTQTVYKQCLCVHVLHVCNHLNNTCVASASMVYLQNVYLSWHIFGDKHEWWRFPRPDDSCLCISTSNQCQCPLEVPGCQSEDPLLDPIVKSCTFMSARNHKYTSSNLLLSSIKGSIILSRFLHRCLWYRLLNRLLPQCPVQSFLQFLYRVKDHHKVNGFGNLSEENTRCKFGMPGIVKDIQRYWTVRCCTNSRHADIKYWFLQEYIIEREGESIALVAHPCEK